MSEQVEPDEVCQVEDLMARACVEHKLEQATEAQTLQLENAARQHARGIAAYYNELLERGVPHEEAAAWTRNWQERILKSPPGAN